MSLLDALDLGLAGVVLTVAAWTILIRSSFSAALGYVAYGLLLALIWARLAAIDVAIAEAAIGGGVTGVLLIGAARRLREAPQCESERLPVSARLAAAALCAVVALAVGLVVLGLPRPSPGLAPLARERLGPTGLGNPVTAVLMVFRAFDTLLEKIVLLLAVVGVWSLAQDRFWGGAPGPAPAPAPRGALAFLARTLPPFGLLVGVHLLWVSKDDPGGAFQGGAVIAAMWLIVVIARLAPAPPVASRRLRLALVAGPAVFLAVGLAGALVAGAVFALPQGWSVPLILIVEAFMTLTVAATLPMLVAGPPDRTPERSEAP
ncbi:hydrogenase subunit MbhD domain-containing protein [Methylocella sp.]|uniref:hydrogenase subunit MbhD domain-containing protein n=1 Tax=Methylocella sp. TaxID=1978226 RepID=UPI0035B26370